ncbi:MAG TPA: DUF2007 domain-containing protein [Nitrospirae bacterium]|nr:DUF2007 domain-containing protein [Nitrospirota bacterium]
MEQKWIEIYVSLDSLEADMITELLKSCNIEVMVKSYRVSPYPVNIGRLAEIRIFVLEQDSETAREIIKSDYLILDEES